MDICTKLHEDPCIRALLWCLIGSDELNVQTLKDSGLSDTEAHAIIKDEPRLLRRLKQRHAMAERMTVKDLASMLRDKLSEHIGNAAKATELSCLLRCLKALPSWLFPEWEQAELAKLAEKGLKRLAGSNGRNGNGAVAATGV